MDIWSVLTITGAPALAYGVAYLRYVAFMKRLVEQHGVEGLKAAKVVAPPLRRPSVK
ncbi:hypothetical protein [Geodermatophilus dictyosporus]|uniref:hypothetical protein n=1 Tax=Geodermatophilus dictyosporus TaxID=1523247 RepID=UPI00145C2DFB|nr:hypothetical protein [Geodermatophilus dictyosporus]